MTTPTEAFMDAAIGAINALRLFAHNTRLPEASFTATHDRLFVPAREVIQFRSTQSFGDLIRTKDSVTISVSPIVGLAQNFAARRLVFNRGHFLDSRLNTASSEEMLANDGRDFIHEFCALIDRHQRDSHLKPIHWDGEDHLLVSVAATEEQNQHRADVDTIASAINAQLAIENATIFLAHPAFDMPGRILLINDEDKVLPWPTDGKLRERLNDLSCAASDLVPALRFTLINQEFPATYAIRPHAFTLQPAEDASVARAQGIGAAARVAIRQQSSDILSQFSALVYVKKPIADPSTFAGNLLVEDWCAALGEARPQVINTEIKIDDAEGYDILVTISADTEAAERYKVEGSFDLNAL